MIEQVNSSVPLPSVPSFAVRLPGIVQLVVAKSLSVRLMPVNATSPVFRTVKRKRGFVPLARFGPVGAFASNHVSPPSTLTAFSREIAGFGRGVFVGVYVDVAGGGGDVGVRVAVGSGPAVLVRVFVAKTVLVLVLVEVFVRVAVLVRVGVRVGVAVFVLVDVNVCVGVAVVVIVLVREAVAVDEGVRVNVDKDVLVGLNVTVTEPVGVTVPVTVLVPITPTGITVAVPEGIAWGVRIESFQAGGVRISSLMGSTMTSCCFT